MTFKNKRRLRIIRDYCLGWTLALMFLSIVRGIGTDEHGSVQFDIATSLFLAMILGPLFGSISGYAQILSEEKIYRCISIQKLLLLRFIYIIFLLISLVLVTYAITTIFMGVQSGFLEFVFDGAGSYAVYFYLVVVEIVLAVISQVNMMLGRNKLSQMLLGKFYRPHEEERIFMFLDLQASTELAEKLGHINYSSLLQDCFNDLGVVVENEAEIYQYVGDEAVLTWKREDGLRNNNCVNAYFNFKDKLESKSQYYLNKYNCLPFFKAGVNCGMVTVAEVGKYKREIAYHGDAINTAARIQGKCNELNRELLISRSINQQLSLKQNINVEEMGTVALKGKQHQVEIYSVGLAS